MHSLRTGRPSRLWILVLSVNSYSNSPAKFRHVCRSEARPGVTGLHRSLVNGPVISGTRPIARRIELSAFFVSPSCRSLEPAGRPRKPLHAGSQRVFRERERAPEPFEPAG